MIMKRAKKTLRILDLSLRPNVKNTFNQKYGYIYFITYINLKYPPHTQLDKQDHMMKFLRFAEHSRQMSMGR